MKKLLLFVGLALVFIGGSSHGGGRWHWIGKREAGYSPDRDVIRVRGNDRFSALRFRVTDACVDIRSMEVKFEDGSASNFQIRTRFRNGDESRVIDLPGCSKRIRKITFWYDTKGLFNGKSDIWVYGMR
jgi:hypothetical protein